jgi:hypothetical protein
VVEEVGVVIRPLVEEELLLPLEEVVESSFKLEEQEELQLHFLVELVLP